MSLSEITDDHVMMADIQGNIFQAQRQERPEARSAQGHEDNHQGQPGTSSSADSLLKERLVKVQGTVGGKIPSDWLPAPNLGPNCYIVPSPNPHKEPYVVHVDPPPPVLGPAPSPSNSMEARKELGPPLQPKKKKKKKDPNAPKRPPTAYLLFITQHRDAIKEELGATANPQDITKILAERWTQITPEAKKALQDQVDIERMRYEEEMRHYVPPPLGLDGEDEEDAPKKRGKKDADAPRRPRTAYILFSIDYRKDVDKDIDFRAATAMAATAWSIAEPEVRDKYFGLAANEKDAYDAAVKVYKTYKAEREAVMREEQKRIAQEHFHIPDLPSSSGLHLSPSRAQQHAKPKGQPRSIVAGYPTNTLERLNLEVVKQALKREKLHPDTYYMLVDVWRHDSPRLEAALRAYRLHIEGQKKPDYKGFLVGIFGLEVMRPLMASEGPQKPQPSKIPQPPQKVQPSSLLQPSGEFQPAPKLGTQQQPSSCSEILSAPESLELPRLL